MRHLIFRRKVVDQALRVLGFVRHHPGKVAFQMRVIGIETFGDKIRVVAILGENDGFTQPVAAGDFLALGHQGFQHLIDGVGVEQPLIDGLGIDFVRGSTVLVPFQRIPCFLFLLGQVIILDAFTLEF